MNIIFKSIIVRYISKQSLQSRNLENLVASNLLRIKLDGNNFATVEYEHKGNCIDLIHTIVPDQYKGQGIGQELAKKTFDYIISEKKKMILTCSFLKRFYEMNRKTYENHVIEN